MINTLTPNIVYCGDYGSITSKWFDLDDSENDDLRWNEISKTKDMDSYEMSEVIDNSEFVIRPSLLRTQAKSKWCEHNYGRKIDVIMTRLMGLPHYLDISHSKRIDSTYLLGQIELIFSRKWLYLTESRHIDGRDTPVNISSRYGLINNRIQSQMMVREVWVCTCHFIAWVFKRFKYQGAKVKKIIEDNINRFYDEYGSAFSENLVVLPYDDYMEWLEKVRSYHLSLDEMCDRWGHKKWWQEYLSRKEEHHTYETMASRIDAIKDNLILNRGQECLAIMFTDKRFNGLNKLFVGHHALWNAFEHGISHGNQFAEYRLITELIKDGKLRYIPEHMDSLKEEMDSGEVFDKYYMYYR